MAEGSGQHANTRPGNGTGAQRGGEAQLFHAATTLHNTRVLSGDTPMTWSPICLMPLVRACSKPVGMPRDPRCQRHTPFSARRRPGRIA